MRTFATFLSLLVLASAALAASNGTDVSCDLCDSMLLESDGGFADEYPRYLGYWKRSGTYEGQSFYMCLDCMGLRDKLIFIGDRWAVVDCEPGNVACGGSHQMLKSVPADGFCPYDDIGPWQYCDGDLIVGGSCTHYSTDETVRFTCE
eukprot:maker-scaffold289_size220122-snap-gene-1.27 protein:Tk01620 transcript:maker-scaffold289_size220122-snap-gene-1.27-mRNA-1 annotation:"hypothetical protein EMH_0003250"